MRRTVLVAVVLLSIGVVHAGPVYHWQEGTLTDPANSVTDPPPAYTDMVGQWFLPPEVSPGYAPPWYRYLHQDWGWDHAMAYPADPSPDNSGTFDLLSATLTIHAWGVRHVTPEDPTLIYADGILLGELVSAGDNTWTTTVFDIKDIVGNLDLLLDGELNIWMDIDVEVNGAVTGVGVIVGDSLLDVTYRWDWYEWEDVGSPVVPVPVPGAVAMAGLGTCLVGWIRGRRYL